MNEMTVELFENAPPLLPLEFFSLSCSIRHGVYSLTEPSMRKMRSNYLLPGTAELLGEEKFAEVALLWNEEGISVEAFIDKSFEEAFFPLYSKGDAIELFFDTRDLKTAGFATRFCHQFVILPQAVQEIQALETTRFRTEDTHTLCDPSDIAVQTDFRDDSYSVRILIPADCLHGYDPKSYDRIGFTYRIHRYGGAPQHFAVSSEHFALEQAPRLWASATMTK
jgi:hypothetical protein